MDTFIDSSWYFLRFPDARNDQQIFAPQVINDWAPVDQYIGGIEHAILHLLYARFVTKFLRDQGLLSFDEPFKQLLTQGMVQGLTYRNPTTKKCIPSTLVDPANPHDPDTNEPLTVDYETMSKSKYNGVAPAEVIGEYGADTARMFILFKAPPEKELEWATTDVEGQFRFLKRIWNLVYSAQQPVKSIAVSEQAIQELRFAINTAIKEVTEDLGSDTLQCNTAISELMKLTNALSAFPDLAHPEFQAGLQVLIKMLAPFAPHIAEELWAIVAFDDGSIHRQTWPSYDPSALTRQTFTLVVQVNGKIRANLEVPIDSPQTTVEALSWPLEAVQKYTVDKNLRKTIYVPNKLINFVVG
jgi:leucyl-tRNA synthetase